MEETFYSSIMLSHAWCATFFWKNLSCWLTCWEICSAPSQKKGRNIRKIKIHLTAKLLYNEHHVTCLNTQWLILIKVNPENHARQRNKTSNNLFQHIIKPQEAQYTQHQCLCGGATISMLQSRGGALGIFGWGCAAETLEPLAYTRASSSEFCYPILD